MCYWKIWLVLGSVDVVNVMMFYSWKLMILIYKLEERIILCFKRNKVGEMCFLFGFEIL